MALQHIADRPIADLIPEVGQCSHDPVIAPIMVLLGHADDQLLDLSTDPRPSGATAGFRAIEFAGNQLAVPGQNRIRPGHSRHLGEGLAAQSMADLSQHSSLGVRQLQPPLQLGLQDLIFGGQIFGSRKQFLVHRPRDVSQDARPIHSSSTPADSRSISQKILASPTRRGHAGSGIPTIFFDRVSIF
jgi:hypothetical protein